MWTPEAARAIVDTVRSPVLAFSRVVALLCCLGGGASHAFGQRKTPEEIQLPPPPPQPVPLKLEVARDGTVEAPLRVYGAQIEALRFRIRTNPLFGKLEEIHPTGRESASVVYHPPASLAVKGDKFSYSVQNSRGVSAPAEIVIAIIDLAPLLIVPDLIPFPQLIAGSVSSRQITIFNQGGSMAEGEVSVSPPWRIEGNRGYRLGSGQRQSFTVIFAPTAPGEYAAEVRYSSHLDRVTSLKGECLGAVSFNPPTVDLEQTPETTVRSGAAEVINHTEVEQILQTQPNPRLDVPATVSIPAGGKTVLAIQTKPDDVGPLFGDLVFQGDGAAYRLDVHAVRVGPVLEWPKDPIHLQTVAGRSGAASIRLQNIGGAEGFYRFEAPPPLEISPAECRLFAGEQKQIDVRLPASEQDHYRSWLKIVGERQTVEIPIDADISARTFAPGETRGAGPTAAVAIAAVPIAEERTESVEETPNRPTAPRPPAPCKVVASTGRTVTLEWPATLSSATRYVVEERKLTFFGEGAVKESWVAHAKTSFRTENGQVQAELRDLAPSTVYTVRVVPLGVGEEHKPLLFELKVATQSATTPMLTPMRGLIFLLIVCIGIGVWRKYRSA